MADAEVPEAARAARGGVTAPSARGGANAPSARGGADAPSARGGLKLFVDLDGVLADFDRGVVAVTGRRPEDLPLKTMWAALSRAPAFFDTLEFMHDAEALWRFCEPHHPTILTGLPLGQWAPAQKARWVARMLGAHVPVITCMSREKPRWSGPGHVLLDDRASAREGWEAKGGIFVHHVSAERSTAALRELGFIGEAPRGI